MANAAQIVAGSRITAALLQAIAPLAVIKPADQPVTGSVAFVNDTALVLAVAANATYLFDCTLDYEGGTQGSSDLKWQFITPALSALRYGASFVGTAGGVTENLNTASSAVAAGTNGAGNLRPVLMSGTFITGANAGSIQLQWAQNTSNATSTIVHAQSRLALWRIT